MKRWLGRHAVLAYVGLTFGLSWGAALGLLLPRLSRGEPIPTWYGLLTFPAMLLGPAVAGLGLSALLDSPAGADRLLARLGRWRLPPAWYLLALVAPASLLLVLLGLAAGVSEVFQPRLYVLGFLFGPIAGLCEELGWTGFALPRLRARFGLGRASLLLGLVWGLWHLPVLDFLGAASPHGAWLVPFFGAFVLVLLPMRLLISLAATRTRSVPIAQLLHASLTGSLAMLSPAPITPAQEAGWYAIFGAALCLVVVALAWGLGLQLRPRAARAVPELG